QVGTQAHGAQGQARPDRPPRLRREPAQYAGGGIGSEIHTPVGRGRHRHADTMNLTRVWWALGALLVVAATVVCLIPFQEVPQGFELNDKISHLIGHGSLALYFAGLVPRRGWWKIFAYLLLFGVAIEFAQYYM